MESAKKKWNSWCNLVEIEWINRPSHWLTNRCVKIAAEQNEKLSFNFIFCLHRRNMSSDWHVHVGKLFMNRHKNHYSFGKISIISLKKNRIIIINLYNFAVSQTGTCAISAMFACSIEAEIGSCRLQLLLTCRNKWRMIEYSFGNTSHQDTMMFDWGVCVKIRNNWNVCIDKNDNWQLLSIKSHCP